MRASSNCYPLGGLTVDESLEFLSLKRRPNFGEGFVPRAAGLHGIADDVFERAQRSSQYG